MQHFVAPGWWHGNVSQPRSITLMGVHAYLLTTQECDPGVWSTWAQTPLLCASLTEISCCGITFSADRKRGQRKGTTSKRSKILKKCEDKFRHSSRRAKLIWNRQNRHTVSKQFSTLFDSLYAAPTFRPLFGGSDFSALAWVSGKSPGSSEPLAKWNLWLTFFGDHVATRGRCSIGIQKTTQTGTQLRSCTWASLSLSPPAAFGGAPEGNWRILPSSHGPFLPTLLPSSSHPACIFLRCYWSGAVWGGVGEGRPGLGWGEGAQGGRRSSTGHLGPDPHPRTLDKIAPLSASGCCKLLESQPESRCDFLCLWPRNVLRCKCCDSNR